MTKQDLIDAIEGLTDLEFKNVANLADAFGGPSTSGSRPQSGVSIGSVLQLDRASGCNGGLAECLGDRYLCANNSVYRAVRRLAIQYGCRFSDEGSMFSDKYDAIPLLCLDDILREGIVPYRRTTAAAETLVGRSPMLCLESDLIHGNNHLLHESAHFVVDRFLFPGVANRAGNARGVIDFLLCESYAAAIERVAMGSIGDPIHDWVFRLNSFLKPNRESVGVLRQAIDVFGVPAVLRLGVFALLSLSINPMVETVDEQTTQVIVNTAMPEGRITPAERAVATYVIQSGFILNQRFRQTTTPVFFSYLGLRESYERVRKCSLDNILWESPAIVNDVSRLVAATSE